MNIDLDITSKISWIHYVLVACKLKIYHITFCTGIIFTTNRLVICDNCESISDDNKKVFLYGGSHFDENKNEFILEATINYIKNSEKFSGSISA